MVELRLSYEELGRRLGIKPEANPVLGVQSGWDRTDLMETARKEIDKWKRYRFKDDCLAAYVRVG